MPPIGFLSRTPGFSGNRELLPGMCYNGIGECDTLPAGRSPVSSLRSAWKGLSLLWLTDQSGYVHVVRGLRRACPVETIRKAPFLRDRRGCLHGLRHLCGGMPDRVD